MSPANWAFIVLAAAASGGAIGFVIGFAVAAHRDVLAGVRVSSRYRVLGLFARPSSELTWGQTLAVFGVVIAWVVIFFALCAAPFLVAASMHLEGVGPIVTGIALAAAYVLARAGKSVWANVSKHAV